MWRAVSKKEFQFMTLEPKEMKNEMLFIGFKITYQNITLLLGKREIIPFENFTYGIISCKIDQLSSLEGVLSA